MKISKIIIILFTLLLLASTVSAVGIVKKSKNLYAIYEPGKTYTFNFFARGDTPQPEDVKLYVQGEFRDFYTVEPNYLEKMSMEDRPFMVILNFPLETPKPGEYNHVIYAEEMPVGSGDTITMKARAGWNMMLRVRFPGKYVEPHITTHGTGVGEPENVIIKVNNYGSEDLSDVYALVQIFDTNDVLMGTQRTESVSIKFDQDEQISAQFDTTDYKKGVYYAQATIFYDGNSVLTNNSEFNVGTLEMALVNHTDKFQRGIIQKFNISAKNEWNKGLKSVYATAKISKDGVFIDEIKTLSSDFNAWEVKPLEGYFDLRSITELGEYDFDVELHYEDKTTKTSSTIHVVKDMGLNSEKPMSVFLAMFATTTNLLVLLVAVLIGVNIFLFMYLRKREKK